MLTLSSQPLEQSNLKRGLADPKSGAFASFEGLVRNHNEGKSVVALEYEAFPELAQNEAKKIFKEAQKKFDIITAKCVHRVGKLNVGDMAVWVGVVAPHRDAAFKACRYIIDEIKHRVPIWKKEYYTNGVPAFPPNANNRRKLVRTRFLQNKELRKNEYDSGWVICEACAACVSDRRGTARRAPTRDENEFYSRQLILPMVGTKGQAKLKKSKVLVVGAGGLGTPALQYLAAAGVGTIGICEFDVLEASNLHRQVLYAHQDLGKSKVELAAQRLKSINPFIHIKIHAERLTTDNVESIIQRYDILLDGSDNFLAKYLLNDAAVLNRIPLVVGSVYQLEGQLRFIQPQGKFSCLRCLWPQMPPRGCVGSCAETGIIGVVPGIVGTYEALEVIKFLLGLPTLGKEDMLIFDFTSGSLKTVRIPRDPACPLCGKRKTIKKINLQNYLDPQAQESAVDVDISSISKNEFSSFRLVDIREPKEVKNNPVDASVCARMPLSQIEKGKLNFHAREKYLIFCGKGFRSHRLARELQKQGMTFVFSVRNGVNSVKNYLKENVQAQKHHN